jgi:hypothetical protein
VAARLTGPGQVRDEAPDRRRQVTRGAFRFAVTASPYGARLCATLGPPSRRTLCRSHQRTPDHVVMHRLLGLLRTPTRTE